MSSYKTDMASGRCPGQYCGRIDYDNGTLSECGACPRGYRVNATYVCEMCVSEVSPYSWFYLGFMMAVPLMLHCFFIDLDAKDRSFSRKQIILTACAVVEVGVSAILAVLWMPPNWEFRLNACEVRKISDWYTLLHNPTPRYEQHLHCTQEAVYPLQTIVLVYYFLCLISMFAVRPVACTFFDVRGRAPIYAALYFLPLLTFVHAMGGGLIYYSFPYLSIVISMISNAIHYSMKLDQSFKGLLKSSLCELKNFVIIVLHWLFLAYGIVALGHHYLLLALVPFPSIFYIITEKFTDPGEFREIDIRPNMT